MRVEVRNPMSDQEKAKEVAREIAHRTFVCLAKDGQPHLVACDHLTIFITEAIAAARQDGRNMIAELHTRLSAKEAEVEQARQYQANAIDADRESSIDHDVRWTQCSQCGQEKPVGETCQKCEREAV